MCSRTRKTGASADRVAGALNGLGFGINTQAAISKGFVVEANDVERRIPVSGHLGKSDIVFLYIPHNQEGVLRLAKSLFHIASVCEYSSVKEDFSLYVNIIRLGFSNMEREIRNALDDSSLNVVVFNEETNAWLETMKPGVREDQELNDLFFDAPEFRVMLSIYWNFITKKLNSANVEKWYKKESQLIPLLSSVLIMRLVILYLDRI